MKLSPTQTRAYSKLLKENKSVTAYDIRESLPTLRALARKGFAVEVTPAGPGGMFSPRTHCIFRAVKPNELHWPAFHVHRLGDTMRVQGGETQ